MKQQKGFTLIELIVVIVILGILAATALPRFVNMQQDAADAAVQGVAAGLSSASAINFGARSLSATRPLTPNTITACDDLNAGMWGLLAAGRPANYTITNATACANGVTTCTVQFQTGATTSVANAPITCY